ncbi:MAG: ketopantoate reductase family protein [Chloroflexales bacterium]|nr:ketopantoate reductase family protein [Chloroflexales bacterium]
MTIVIVGGGAIGLLVAGRLAQSGQCVAVLGRPGAVEALQAGVLQIIQKGQVANVTGIVAASAPEQLPPDYQHPDLSILCVKGYDTTAALPTLAALQSPFILTLQNGIGNEETLVAAFGPSRVLSGVITSSVEPEAPGRIVVTKAGGIGLAPLDNNSHVTSWAMTLRHAGFAVHECANHRSLKWSKALLNMLGNATVAILDMPIDAIYADPRLLQLERQAFLEALAVMQRIGATPINLPRYPAALLAMVMRWMPPALLFPLLRKLIAGGRGGKAPSLHVDLCQGRSRSEGAYLYGAIAAKAHELGMGAPINATLWRILEDIVTGQRPWADFRRHPERLLAEMEQMACQSA